MALTVTALLVIGTTESARVNAVLVAIKVAALTAFVALTMPVLKTGNFSPFTPNGWFGPHGHHAAWAWSARPPRSSSPMSASTRSRPPPKRPRTRSATCPIGLIGSLALCTVFYLLVAAGAIGAIGAQPVLGLDGSVVPAWFGRLPGRLRHRRQRQPPGLLERGPGPRPARDQLAGASATLLGLAANLALPSVILMMIYGQTRIFFVMARDGLLPRRLATIHPKWKTPHVVTIFTGVCVAIAAALFPVGQLADISNSGTLFAFFMVAIAVMVLRAKDPNRPRPFKTPLVWVIAPLAMVGCAGLYFNLPIEAMAVLPIWGALGLVIYFAYGYRKSHVGRGHTDEVHELDPDAPPTGVPGKD